MANFDFIESASEGYKFVWEKRRVLAPLAALPFVAKIALFGLVILFGLEENYLRQGLILIPFYAVEGWMLSVLIRMAVWGDNTRTLKMHDGAELAPTEAVRALRAGIITFVILKLVGAAVSGLAMENGMEDMLYGDPVGGSSLIALAGASGLLIVTLWAFRLLWLYVPAALGYSLRGYMAAMRGFKSSFQIVALWLMCFIPLFVVMIMALEFLNGAFPNANIAEGGNGAVSLGLSVITGGFEIMIDMVAAASAAFAVHTMMRTDK